MEDYDTLVRNLCIAFLALIFTSIILIIWRLIKLQREMRRISMKRCSYSTNLNEVHKSLQNIKVIVIQVMVYLLSFTMSFGILFIRSIINEPNWAVYLSFILIPLQGLFNALIFISHKVYNYRRVHRDVSRWSVIKLLFQGNAKEPFLISRISLVEKNDHGEAINIEISNENGDKVLHIDKHEAVSASQSGGKVFVDEESGQDLDGLSWFSSSQAAPNFPSREISNEQNFNDFIHIYEDDKESKRDINGLSEFASVVD